MKDGRLAVLAVVQEQHADRARLFAQWKRIDWPILHDPINVLEPLAVPIFVAIDEAGIVRAVKPDLNTFEADFLNKDFGAATTPIAPKLPDPSDLKRIAESANTADAWRDLGDALALWAGPERLAEAMDAYSRSLKLMPNDGNALFRLGVCHRLRYDSAKRQPGDFQAAIDLWGRALAENANQYIWRRRIQQYGPRLDKPYAFYDWVAIAEKEIAERGEKPVRLVEEPYGAEIANPLKEFAPAAGTAVSPDPEGKVARDKSGLVAVGVAVVPKAIAPGRSARVHLSFRVNGERKVHWNNEAGPLRLWIDAPEGWQVSERLLSAPLGEKPETTEPRRLDLEVKAPEAAAGRVRLGAYALYYVCEDAEGQCAFLRHDIPIDIEVRK